jgi:hypothetical protein
VVFAEALVPGGWWALPRCIGFAGIVAAVAVLGSSTPETAAVTLPGTPAPDPATVPVRPILGRVEPAG